MTTLEQPVQQLSEHEKIIQEVSKLMPEFFDKNEMDKFTETKKLQVSKFDCVVYQSMYDFLLDAEKRIADGYHVDALRTARNRPSGIIACPIEYVKPQGTYAQECKKAKESAKNEYLDIVENKRIAWIENEVGEYLAKVDREEAAKKAQDRENLIASLARSIKN